MRITALALALALSTSLVTPGLAATVAPLAPAAAPLATPGAEPGALRTWVQLVWNPVTRRLDRLAFTAWDPIPSLGLELSWTPDDPAGNVAGPLNGRGTLSFRKPGAASYDRSAALAQYRGALRDGRADGQGEFLDATGFSYAGGWADGLMEGQGRLTLADGDEYVGAFHAGLRDGKGIFTDATGHAYAGQFTAGLPDAQAILAQAEGDLRLGVVTERRPHDYSFDMDPLNYTSKSDGEVLDILPDDQRLLDVWHGNVPITMNDAEALLFDSAGAHQSFLGRDERFQPVPLVFSLENTATDTVSVVGGYLDVASSARDGEPAIQVRSVSADPCSSGVFFSPEFNIDNFGWAIADNATLSLSAGSSDGRIAGAPLRVPLGAITDTVAADTTELLAGLGLDTDLVAHDKLHCTDPNDERLCLAELKRSGHFGQLADYLSLAYTTVSVTVMGTLDYDWAESGATDMNHKTSSFSVVIPVASVANDAECGEGGEPMPVRRDPFELHLDEKGYKIAMPFSADVEPGFTARWRIELGAPETSLHDFSIVLLLADGTQVRSRPIHLTWFMPPKHTDN